MPQVTATFDSRAEAERTVEMLVQQHGIDRGRISVRAAGAENATAGTSGPRDEAHHGFQADDTKSGGILVAVEAPDDQRAAVVEAFARHGAEARGPGPG